MKSEQLTKAEARVAHARDRRIGRWRHRTTSTAAQPLRDGRSICWSRFGYVGLFLFALLGSVRTTFGADILFPIVEPRLPITAHALQGSKTTRGAYTIYELSGNCRIEQAGFSAQGQRMQLWIDHYATNPEDESDASDLTNNPNARWMYKVIIRVDDNVQVEWANEQRLEDATWMGRLYSHREPMILVDQGIKDKSAPRNEIAATPPDKSLPTNEEASNSSSQGIVLAQFEELPSRPRGSEAFSIPPPQELKPTVIPPANPTTGRQGSLIEPSPSNPLGGLILDGDIDKNLPTEEITALQVPTDSLNQAVPPGSPGLAQGLVEPNTAPRIGARTFELTGRGVTDPQFDVNRRPDRGDTIITLKRGLRIRFGGATVMTSTGPMELGTVVLEADRAIIWTANIQQLMSRDIEGLPIEVYLEGNVVFEQGPRKIYADRMYYNVQAESGMVLGAEVLTPAPQFEGIVRLKADVVEQRSRQDFLAYNAAITSSRLGVPRYWLQSDRLSLNDPRSSIDQMSSSAMVRTGTTNMEATARNNFVYFGGVPVLYWPVMTSNIDSPNFYLRSIKVKNDSIFGQQVFLDWDLYQLLGIDGPDGTDWRLSTDYLSNRGFALGTTYRYNVPNTLLPGPATGYFDVWGLNDKGLDNLGNDRSALAPERDTRGRLIYRHRQYLTRDLELWAEVGLISDRNFVEQYFEREWDEEKDASTALRLRRYADNRMLDIVGQPRINRFFTETEWLPKIDHYVLGQSIFDRLTWYARSNVGYAHQRVATTPVNASEAAKFQLQPWEVDAEGIRAGTRQELALPLNAGPFKIVPYVNGEVMTWGEDVTGNSLTRLTGQTGVRSTVPMWRSYPEYQSRLFNVNGIAHKVNWNAEFFYADSNKNIDQLPLYDPLDDNSQEHFRRRLVFNTFGGVLPDKFDSRSFALRQGLQRYVTASSSEVVEDQMQFRVGLDQRWQTKRGLVGRERITDLFEFDVDAILFPKADRDNFGETVGAINYDMRFHIGDRYTFLSDGYFDVFDQGLQIFSGGMLLTRPGRGDYYFGLTSIRGPIHTLVANSNINYRMNEKWIVNGGSTFDLGEVGNVGQSASLIRVGESFLAQIGINIDSGRDNASVFFNLEPRFFPFRGLGSLGGQVIPPAGLYGLE